MLGWKLWLPVFLAYQALSLFIFGGPALRHPADCYTGMGTDPTIHMWCLTWWPYALSHHLNPFLTKVVWAPTGVNLTWADSMAGLSLLGWPITWAWGPVVSWNLLRWMEPSSAGLGAFLLCRYVTGGALWPSIFGGYLFGFSPYMLGHMLGHLSFVTTFPLPLAALVVLLKLDDRLAVWSFIGLFAGLVVLQFLSTQELLADAAVIGFFVMVASIILAPSDLRSRLIKAAALIGCAFGLAAVILSPYLYYELRSVPHEPIRPPEHFSIDLLNLVIPTNLVKFNGDLWLNIASRFDDGNGAEATGYLGLPLLLIVWSYAITQWSIFRTKVLTIALLLTIFASLGPVFLIGGAKICTLPWSYVAKLPLIQNALPCRFTVFAFLAAAVTAAVYLSTGDTSWPKLVLALAVVISVLPNPQFSEWTTQVDTPVFFSSGVYKAFIRPDENVLVLPFGDKDQSMLWQAQSKMYFRMAGGYLGIPPPEFAMLPILQSLNSGQAGPHFNDELIRFLVDHGVTTIVAADQANDPWPELLRPLKMRSIQSAGVVVYRAGGGEGGAPLWGVVPPRRHHRASSDRWR